MTGSDKSNPKRRYEITLEGPLDPSWSLWFSDLAIHTAQARDGKTLTTLSGTIPDQAALRGILVKLWDLNLTLISISSSTQA